MESALTSGMENATDYLHLWKAYIFYERRRIDWSQVDFEHPDDGIISIFYCICQCNIPVSLMSTSTILNWIVVLLRGHEARRRVATPDGESDSFSQ